MKENKKYYKDLDFIRVFACIAVLLYHLNILKGGYLAVCVFFVLSGFLSCISAFKKEKFSFLGYYKNRFFKIYLPLIIVAFCTVTAVSLFSNINWFNLKPETTSVVLGFNNFWQLDANLDYFARHVSSPFMHLWYIGILLQFDIVFPFIYYVLRKSGDKINKNIPIIASLVLSIGFSVYFYVSSLNNPIMVTYYNTFTRIFSILFGVTIGYVHSYYNKLIPKKLKEKIPSKIIFYTYILVLTAMFIFIDAQSVYFPVCMILSTLITCRLIDYGSLVIKEKLSGYHKVIKSISSISYEIYLLQYPIIFLFQYINMSTYIELVLIIAITIILSYILHFGLNFKGKHKIARYITASVFTLLSIFGIYKYIIAEDHTAEMKELENQLAENLQLSQQKQLEYEQKLKKEQEDWLATLNDLEKGEEELKNIVSNLSVVGIGDSVMLGAASNLYQQFPNGYFNAEISRTAWVANDLLKNLKSNNILGEPVILNLGANGDCTTAVKNQILNTCDGRKVFWINVTNDYDVHVNADLAYFASFHNNLYVIDWNSISNGHPEYFLGDGIHLTDIGKQVYTKAIYDAIYEVYLKEYEDKKQQIINNHEQLQKNKISFYGNDILLNIFDYIQTDYSDAKFTVDKKYTYDTLKENLKNDINNNTITHNIVLAFDNTANISLEQYEELIELCSNYKLYILSTNEQISNIQKDNVSIINFYEELSKNADYIMPDGVHLTTKGNEALSKLINSYLILK